MIPVKLAPEPLSFHETVRVPGQEFLRSQGIQNLADKPTGKIDWSNYQFWRICSKDLYDSYQGICCYVGMRINGPLFVNEKSVEHFIPKSIQPFLAYEWSNYRLACRKANSDRGTKPVIDPFTVCPNEFRLNLLNGELYPDPSLSDKRRLQVLETINNIGLNQNFWSRLRLQYYNYYLNNLKGTSIIELQEFLEKNAPIVLAELKRPVRKIIISD